MQAENLKVPGSLSVGQAAQVRQKLRLRRAGNAQHCGAVGRGLGPGERFYQPVGFCAIGQRSEHQQKIIVWFQPLSPFLLEFFDGRYRNLVAAETHVPAGDFGAENQRLHRP